MDRNSNILLATFLEHRDAVQRFLRRRLRSHALADDLTQETWLRAATAAGPTAILNPRSYLFRIAANLSRDHYRHIGQRVEVALPAPLCDAVADPAPSP